MPYVFFVTFFGGFILPYTAWSPCGYHGKQVRPDWGSFSESFATRGAPIFSNLAYDDRNRLTEEHLGIKLNVVDIDGIGMYDPVCIW